MQEKIFTLTDQEAENIRKGLGEIDYDSFGSTQYLNQLKRKLYSFFPERIIDLLNNQRSSFKPLPYFIIKNFPIDNVNGAPNFYETGIDYKDGYISENIITACSVAVGEPYSAFFEGRELVNNLNPQKNTMNDYTGLGSQKNLDLHIENSALRFMEKDFSPVGLFLLGVRFQENGPKTYIADSREALNMLSKEDQNILRSSSFIIKTPHRWRKYFNYENTDLVPMVMGCEKFPLVNAVFYDDMVVAINDQAKLALSNFYSALQTVKRGIEIGVGDLVFIDNRFALHSREIFKPQYDSNGNPLRWLQRVFISSNLWEWRSLARNGRVFFKENGSC